MTQRRRGRRESQRKDAMRSAGQCEIVWEFRVRRGRAREFERRYGPRGDWARFFRRDPAYRGTDLLRADASGRRYVTVDRWSSRAACDAFRARFEVEYAAIDRRCERLTEEEAEIWRFRPIPGRVPTAR